ncbi:PepSY domain-containing protein [Rhodopseudomonas palustris]|uniref:PepSY-associated TM helix domain-containing protein n=1 Tax=Rhodopseudomonas palustris TaxID=1076 RepID=UPI00115E8714|nr:PepSY-associated TM helix domain-containing protein [Rhodopseudomonas palustris]QDL99876.1 PepSY domain-containing protein [Rhodopseudomonas palustris]
MNNVLLLKLHRWTSLVFALPLLAVIVTGLILSLEPMLQSRGLPAGVIDAARLTELIQRHDPDGKARGLAINATGQQMRLLGVGTGPIDLATGEAAASDPTGDLLLWARRTHERLLGSEWLVIASTIALTMLMAIGVLMGLPRLRNSVAGWHKGAAWFTLPLLVLSPLTGLCIAFGLTFSSGPPPARLTVKLTDAVERVAQSHDVSRLTMIANRGGRMIARIYQDGELRAYTFTPDGVTPLPRNWPRLLHEGNWSTWLSGTLNVVTSVVLLGLLITGVWLWTRRKLRRRRPPSRHSGGPAVAAPL